MGGSESVPGSRENTDMKSRGATQRGGIERGMTAVEYAKREGDACFNHRRLLGSIGGVPPPEHEQAYHRLNDSQAMAA